jgi:hypothetical protein
MSLPWIKVYGDLFEHPRARDLGDELGRPIAWAHLVALWGWCAQYAPTGRVVAKNPTRTIEHAAKWDGDAGRFVAAAVATGWLDPDGDGFRICGWDDHQKAHLDKAVKDKNRLAAERETKRQAQASSERRENVARQSSDGSASVAGEIERRGEGEETKLKNDPATVAVAPAPSVSAPEQPLLALTPPVARPKREPKAPRPKVVDPAVEAAREARSAEQRAVQADMDRWRDAYCEATGTPKDGPNGFEWTGGAVKHFRLARAKAIAKGGSVDTVIEATRALVADPFWRVKPPEAVLTEKNQTEGANRARAGPASRGGAAAGGFGDHPGGEFDLVTGEHIPAHIALERERAKRAAREAGNGTAA